MIFLTPKDQSKTHPLVVLNAGSAFDRAYSLELLSDSHLQHPSPIVVESLHDRFVSARWKIDQQIKPRAQVKRSILYIEKTISAWRYRFVDAYDPRKFVDHIVNIFDEFFFGFQFDRIPVDAVQTVWRIHTR